MQSEKKLGAMALGALGVVYGDIGTSPLYTIQEVFNPANGVPLSADNIVGAVSAVLWGLFFVVTLKYVVLVLRADNRGEGGILALLALALSSVGDAVRTRRFLLVLGTIGAALFYGDSVITPAVSVLSAMEGLQVVTPELKHWVLPGAVLILVGLFMMQKYGTGVVGRWFGPVILLWFAVLGGVGAWHVLQSPAVLAALNPLAALHFLAERGSGVFLAVGAVVLGFTGAEALYADMGHFGKPAIRLAWNCVVLPCLALNYLGQGALLLTQPDAVSNPFYLSFPPALQLPAVGLATLATIIASQAVISGAYSMTRQAIHMGFLPRLQVVHTSASEAGQVYLPTVNWFLLAAVVMATCGFASSSSLASAYGIAVTGTMLITTVLTFFVVRHAWHYALPVALGATLCFALVDLVLLVSCSVKFFNGGWFPIALAALLLVVMWTWKRGRELLIRGMREDDPALEDFVDNIGGAGLMRVDRTAVFLVSNPSTAPQALMHNLKHNKVLHRLNLIVTVSFADVPWVPEAERIVSREVGHGFWQLSLNYGFMDVPDVPQALRHFDVPGGEIDPFTTSYFLSRETIVPSTRGQMARWREQLFATLARNAGSVVSYFGLPSNGVIELGTRMHL